MNEYGKRVTKKMEDYMDNPDSVDKEVSDIQNAIEGVEVRGALAAGVKKSFDKSKDAEGKADEAHDVMESIINDGFDNAALEANFEQKLDDKIADLQPEWTQFKDDTVSQLAETDSFRGKESTILRKKPTPMITWLDDDGQMGVYEKLYPLAQEYNIVFTSALITSRVGNREGYMNWNHVEELNDSGLIEFVSHTHNHSTSLRPDQMTEEELREDYATTSRILRERGLNYRCVVYPFGTYTEREVEVAKEYFDYGVGTATRGDGLVTGKFDNYSFRRTDGQGYDRLDAVKSQIDRAVNENAWLVLTTHVDQGGWWSEAYAREVIEYALSKGVKFVTTAEGINEHGNVMQVGSNVITAKGEILGNNLNSELGVVVIDNSTSITAETPLDYFKENAITHTRIRANRLGFPKGESGTLETYRVYSSENKLWEYQIYTTTRSKRVYYRNVNEVSNEWDDWVLQGMTQYLRTNHVTINMLPTHPDLKEKITYSAVNTSGHSTFPRQKSGMLITYAQQTDSFAYQEYHIFRSGDVYKRWFDSRNNKWLSWRPAGNTIVLDFNEYNSDNKIEDFDFGITVFSCNSANGGSNLPNNTGGTFTTYYTHENELAWNYQEFKEYGTTNKYIRSAQLNGNWSSWSQL